MDKWIMDTGTQEFHERLGQETYFNTMKTIIENRKPIGKIYKAEYWDVKFISIEYGKDKLAKTYWVLCISWENIL